MFLLLLSFVIIIIIIMLLARSVAQVYLRLHAGAALALLPSFSSSSSSLHAFAFTREYTSDRERENDAAEKLVCGEECKLFVPAAPRNTNITDTEVEAEDGFAVGVARFALDRPRARNAIGKALLTDLEECTTRVVDLVKKQPARVKCVVIHSTSKVFCAGADLKERKDMNDDEVLAYVRRLRSAFHAIQRIPVPTIAALDGMALGGGFELALACDLRVGSHEAVVGLPETRLAIIPGAGGTQRLPRLVGAAKAKDLIFTGRRVKGEDAFREGLLDRYSGTRDAIQEALVMASQISEGGPVALQMAKEAVDRGMHAKDMTDALGVEDQCYSKVIPTKDRLEALRAFSEKRKPSFQGA